jgi:hypothetical protein
MTGYETVALLVSPALEFYSCYQRSNSPARYPLVLARQPACSNSLVDSMPWQSGLE